MKSYFFNAVKTDDLEAYPTGYDRNYDAEDFAAFYKGFFSDGILIKDSQDECLVTASGNTLNVKAGFAIIQGKGIIVEGNETVTATSSGYAVIRVNKTVDVRAAQFLVVSSLLQTADIYDLKLATVTVTGNAVSVIDARSYGAYTGNVKAVDNVLNDVAAAKAEVEAFMGGAAIPGSSDLNNYTTPGNYYVNTTDVCNSLSNCPVRSQVFSLQVSISTATYLGRTQSLIAHSPSYKPTMWVRAKYSNTWSGWGQIF